MSTDLSPAERVQRARNYPLMVDVEQALSALVAEFARTGVLPELAARQIEVALGHLNAARELTKRAAR